MDANDFHTELALSGQVELFSPKQPRYFHVIEQRINTDPNNSGPSFYPEYLVFTITPNTPEAILEPLERDVDTVWSVVQTLFGQGWLPIDPEDKNAPQIPKQNRFLKWQLCRRIR